MELGQHFLVDRRVIRRICDYADLYADDTVLEVGCGRGNLTEELLKRAGKVYGIEIDRNLVSVLRERFQKEIRDGKFELIQGDALKVDFFQFKKFVSNIPYKISSPLTFKLLKSDFEVAVIMYQKEFAERLIANAMGKNYGRLSVIAKSYCRAEILEYVPKTRFRPMPDVDSAIVKIIPKPKFEIRNREVFEDLVTFVFSRKRKMLNKSILEWAELRKLKVNLKENLMKKRPEEVEPEVYAMLADSVDLI
ncbi:MAG TPA: ribosomal RNA small subunit methyltransferase A [Archaeoglobaceae archaeon]|nr:ribosomal RNA small subunit methyltransferase A [Archaeoglobaceae archaeon]